MGLHGLAVHGTVVAVGVANRFVQDVASAGSVYVHALGVCGVAGGCVDGGRGGGTPAARCALTPRFAVLPARSFIFTRKGGVWEQRAELAAASVRADALLGTSVAFASAGRVLLGGAPGDDTSGASRGAVYAWELLGSSASDPDAVWSPMFRWVPVRRAGSTNGPARCLPACLPACLPVAALRGLNGRGGDVCVGRAQVRG